MRARSQSTTCCSPPAATSAPTGTLYPLALGALTGDTISVGAPFFNLTLGPLAAVIVLLMPLGQSLAWKRGDLLGAAQRVTVAAFGGLLIALVLVAVIRGGPTLAAVGLGLAVYLIAGSFVDVASRIWALGQPARVMLARGVGLPRPPGGAAIVHAGLGVTLMGLAATGWGVERIATAKLGQAIDLGPYQATIEIFDRDRARTIPKSWPIRSSAGAAWPWPPSSPPSAAFPHDRPPSPRQAS